MREKERKRLAEAAKRREEIRKQNEDALARKAKAVRLVPTPLMHYLWIDGHAASFNVVTETRGGCPGSPHAGVPGCESRGREVRVRLRGVVLEVF
jgi:hypothetical protein